MARKILTVSELADHLQVHRITIYRLLKSDHLPGFKIGRVWRFDLDEVSSWMASERTSGASIDGEGHPARQLPTVNDAPGVDSAKAGGPARALSKDGHEIKPRA